MRSDQKVAINSRHELYHIKLHSISHRQNYTPHIFFFAFCMKLKWSKENTFTNNST